MNWFEPIDSYCERLEPGFLGRASQRRHQSGLCCCRLYLRFEGGNRTAGSDAWVKGLCLWVVVIGIGSFLFHTFANRWSVQADVVPIQIFIFAYTLFALRRLAGLGWIRSSLGFILIFGVLIGAMTQVPRGWFEVTNGSLGYAPAFIILLGFALYFLVRGQPVGHPLLLAGGLFAVSLSFRSVDMAVCDGFPLGTHFMWHVLNGTLLGVLCLAAVRHGGENAANKR